MNSSTQHNLPGPQAAQYSDNESAVLWSGENSPTGAVLRAVVVGSSSTDAGNAPTSTLRAGLVMAFKSSDGKAYPYDPDANDGTQIPVGVLPHAVNMLLNGAAADRLASVIVGGLIKQNQIVGADARALSVLGEKMLFDALPQHRPGLLTPRGVVVKSADYTVTAADNGLMFIATAAVTFTLPTKANGLQFRFLQTANNDMSVAGSSDLIATNSVGGSLVSFSTSNQKIGSQLLVECIYTGSSTLKWLTTNLGSTTVSVI